MRGANTVYAINKDDTGTSKTSTPKTSTPKSSSPTVNMKSVMALGYGAISAKKLASLVSSGQVTMYTKNGQIYYQKNPRYYQTKTLNLGK